MKNTLIDFLSDVSLVGPITDHFCAWASPPEEEEVRERCLKWEKEQDVPGLDSVSLF